jgi:hypothetical protein
MNRDACHQHQNPISRSRSARMLFDHAASFHCGSGVSNT